MKAHYQNLPVTSTPKQLHDQALAQQVLDGVPQQTTNSPATKAVAAVPVKVPPSLHYLSALEVTATVIGGLLFAAFWVLVATYWKNIVTWVQSLLTKKTPPARPTYGLISPTLAPVQPPIVITSGIPFTGDSLKSGVPHTPGEPLHQ